MSPIKLMGVVRLILDSNVRWSCQSGGGATLGIATGREAAFRFSRYLARL